MKLNQSPVYCLQEHALLFKIVLDSHFTTSGDGNLKSGHLCMISLAFSSFPDTLGKLPG